MKIKPQFEILRQINSTGPLTYNELEKVLKITALKDRGIFAKNLRFLIRKNLVTLSKIRFTTHYLISAKGILYYEKFLRFEGEKN